VPRAGDRLVAVGQRGHIVVSNDSGATWQQSPVPVSSDLTAVYFVNDKKGWAVGHDGVILATSDGGATWALQLDGKRANEAVLADVERKAAAQPTESLKAMLAEAKRNQEQVPTPFSTWFADDKTGYVVGAYNDLSNDDGGTTWTPWFDRTDNPKFLNLYAIRPAAAAVHRRRGGPRAEARSGSQQFRALDTGYKGVFGVTGNDNAVLVFGLRGNVYRSDNAGKSWTKVDVGLPATIVGGLTLGGVIALADVSGRVVTSGDGGKSWKPLALESPGMLTGIADAGAPKLALLGRAA
jgi:photosystem II stability/assembly factor-like uncharacterized protein